jgi:hypothetical protein
MAAHASEPDKDVVGLVAGIRASAAVSPPPRTPSTGQTNSREVVFHQRRAIIDSFARQHRRTTLLHCTSMARRGVAARLGGSVKLTV